MIFYIYIDIEGNARQFFDFSFVNFFGEKRFYLAFIVRLRVGLVG